MKVGIFNRWLPTLGGGERHSLAIASSLACDHKVEIISHTPFEVRAAEDRLSLDLEDVRFRAVPQRPPAELGPFVRKYDLFINASHADFVPPSARHNAMLVYFPVPLPLHRRQRLRRFVARRVIRLGMQPRFVDGVFGLQELDGLHSHGLDRRAQIVLPASAYQPYVVHLSLASTSPDVTAAELMLDGEVIRQVDFVHTEQFVPIAIRVSPGVDRVLTILAVTEATLDTDVQPYLRMTPLNVDTTRFRVYHRAFHQRCPEVGVRLQNIMPGNLTEIVHGYDQLWANSRYTQRWINAYWNLPSTVLYPPVAVDRFPPASKGHRILSVGRFFAGQHNKKHLEMVYAFRRLLGEGLTGWELHLAGSVTHGQRHEDYALEVQAAAQGAPIYIHTNMLQDELVRLYGSSAIYWHAAGFGESPTRHPDRFEHFGISVVEAMAAGCVPLVVGQGGLTELVRHGHDGYLWYTGRELRTLTKQLADDEALRSRRAQAAIVSSRRFSWTAFEKRLYDSLAELTG